MAAQEATSTSQSEESSALDLPSAYDIRDYVLQKPSQEANSEAFSSLEPFSFPCSSDVDPDGEVKYQDNEENHPRSHSPGGSYILGDPLSRLHSTLTFLFLFKK
ncbi:shieldin complex subunit 1 isoform X2 [Loxodonta africana]|uniref:shieldin complex subunit 1 isoform X2 n=1 Tax=Loxodonta africana TaxID=9785 RepID=UPI000C812102|nr:uncharacterized protein C20orf196 homolog isoform X2 [Loxodonta africana]